ncbi:bifunctional phosphopantothenoylcysteine decarboxylase/phosphopantothenate--cysteine ligase CoaBC [Pseudodesulfovibrio sp. F-1]|uniref:Coenzyme A biosynthesis bifunctional protein CoaBC n=1 Tax=Pseudodesulfovibrio alkaliphilus TaxID=2661613 RepID=A0A7K1KNF8_9BACT|nr:bifunctional phosphopantothenoylcysteine decarboxylase/phosphopantothenate--cysteine ligase CoaBC [Pseudodesulfovibrio alkaliphilus]MUM77613.1 bifunctional phosphopantothenoylcysteine decarboxylase/phosphopantothenate--cysteine ligase CoaBC [Pseudodesulfovibrio alkaliphilus]
MQDHFRFAGFMGRRVHLGVAGSIAAFRSLELLRLLRDADITVSATLTEAGSRFVTPLSFEALGASLVYGSMFDQGADSASVFGHLEPGQTAHALVIAPATANILAKLAHGIADDMLSCQALAFPGPRIVAPAMNPRMWEASATRRNWDILADLGFIRVEPDAGSVACGDTGSGRLASLEEIITAVLRAISPQDLAGQRVLVTLGPTREPWDGVRFWSNPSSGIMGACMAMAAHLRGADVTVVAGPVDLVFPSGITVIPTQTALEMHAACLDLWPLMDIGCATAAVADFRPEPHGPGKFKKSGATSLHIDFVPNPDILKSLGDSKRADQRLIGFAAETCDPRDEAARKLKAKGLDLIAANDVSRHGSGFRTPTNEMYVLDAAGRAESWPLLPKTEVAWRLWDHLLLD